MDNKESSFSVIMTVYDHARELEEHLPAFLTQEYEPGYEVIVVDETSTDETPDVLKLFKNDYPHLYSTFLPKHFRARADILLYAGFIAHIYELAAGNGYGSGLGLVLIYGIDITNNNYVCFHSITVVLLL